MAPARSSARLIIAAAGVLTAALALVARPASAQRDGGPTVDAADAGPVARADASVDAAATPDASNPNEIEARRQRAADAFAHGTDAYHRGDFVQAATLFQQAYDALPDPAPLYNLGRSLEAQRDVRGAVAAFQRYLAEAPHAPDHNEVRDHIDGLLQREGQVFIASDPAGAQVFVDDNPLPQPTLTPVVLSLRPGGHVIVLDRPGHTHVTRRFVVEPEGTSTFYLRLTPDPGTLSNAGTRGRVDPRILNRRSTLLLSPRFTFLFGASRPWNDLFTPINVTIGAEASVFVGRSLSAKVHFERIEPSGAWTVLTGDFGYVVPFEDLDIGAYLVAGTAYGWINQSAQASGAAPGPHVLAGGELRVDWVFHHHLALGAFFRATLRNLFDGGSPQSLNSFGLSVSLFL